MPGNCHHPSRPVYFFVHVPKCAGTTFIEHFSRHVPDRFARAPRRDTFGRLLFGGYTDLAGLAHGRDQIDIVAGHSISQSVRQLFSGREIREIVFLRPPLDFIISFYNYKNRRARQKGLGPISFRLFYHSIPINPVSRFILNRYLEIRYPNIFAYSSRERLQVLNDALSQFWFVGSHQYCAEVIATISDEIGIPSNVISQNRAEDDRLTADDIPPRLREQIRRDNQLDQTLFDMWRDTKCTGRPAPIAAPLSRADHTAHVSREISRNFTYPLIRMRRRLAR